MRSSRGWRVALYIAAVMFVSIVITALAMHYLFAALGITPQSTRQFANVTQFAFDYTLYLNLLFAAVAAALVWLQRRHQREAQGGRDHDMHDGSGPKRIAAWCSLAIVLCGLLVFFVSGG